MRIILFLAAVVLIAAVLSWPAQSSQAAVAPTAASSDYRIKYVAYNKDDVVELNVVVGLTTHIIVGPDETLVTYAFGDPAAWDFVHKDNHYFIKAKAANGDTNLALVTDKHNYNFVLHFIGHDTTKDASGKPSGQPIQTPWALQDATLQVAFTYPDEEDKNIKRSDIAKRFASFHGKNYNLNYTMSAKSQDDEIAPINVWDDGRFTYFKFAQNEDLPNVYTVDASGKEAIVNRHMLVGDSAHVIVAEKVARKFTLRLGSDVVGIYNHGFDKRGRDNRTMTASQSVKRTVVAGAQK